MDRGFVDYAELEKLYRPGLEIEAQVSSTQQIGVFVEFGLNGIGLAATGRLKGRSLTDYERGDSLKVRILSFNQQHKKFEVDIIDE